MNLQKNLSITLASLLLVLAGCSAAPDMWKDAKPGQLKVLASFPPIHSLASVIAGEQAHVLCLLTTTGPHEYQFAPTDALYFRGADLVLCNGLELDDAFVGKLMKSSGNRKAPVVRLGNLLPENLLAEGGACCKHDHKDGEHHHHGDFDPHVWLGPVQLQSMVDSIAEKLSNAAPAHQSQFEARAKELKSEIQKIRDEGLALVKTKTNRKLLTMHESMTYFGDGFGLEIVGSIQSMPGRDPDSANLARLVKLCQDKNVAVITVEPQYARTQAELLQEDLHKKGSKVKLVEFDPLETIVAERGDRQPDPKLFLEKYRKNMQTLIAALP